MSQSPVPVADPNGLTEITKYCEKIINQTQADLDLFRHEQIQLRGQILDILEENNRLNTKLEVLKNTTTATDSQDDATREKLTNEALKNVKKQIDHLQVENHELRSLNKSSQKTIQNLESEVQNYRNQLFQSNSMVETKQKYTTAIQLLESTIKKQKNELVKQAEIIESLFDEKKKYNEHIETLEATLKEKNLVYNNYDNTIQSLNSQLQESMRQSKELEESLKLSHRIVEQRYEREKCALQKVQEALAIAESAVADKVDAQKRERVVKEECDNLASTIGQVMDEAARKVDKDMEGLRKRFAEKEKQLLDTQEKLQDEIQNQRKFNQILETRCHRFEQKLKESARESVERSHELQVAIKGLDEMQLKLQANENLRHQEKNAQKGAEVLKRDIQYYIETHKQLKEKYRDTLEDVTKKFEKAIYDLQNENAKLKAENQIIKLQTKYDV